MYFFIDGMLNMRVKFLFVDDFIDIFEKFKFVFNLLVKLKVYIYDFNVLEFVYFLFILLSLIYEVSRDLVYGGRDFVEGVIRLGIIQDVK